MKTIFTIVAFIVCSHAAFSTITVSIVSPAANQVVNVNSIGIKATVASTYDLASVTAYIGLNQYNMIHNASTGYFEATVSLSAMSQGNLSVTVTAIDVFNTSQSAVRNFVYDLAPVVNVEKPISESVTSSTIDFKINISDLDTCTLKIETKDCYAQTISSPIVPRVLYQGTIVDSFQAVFNMLPDVGKVVCLFITVTDKRGSATVVKKSIFVTNNQLMEEVFASKYKIYDFNYNKLLTYFGGYANNVPVNGNTGATPTIITDIATAGETIVPGPVKDRVIYGYLTPNGVMYQDMTDGANDYYTLRDWNNGSLDSLNSLSASGGNGYLKIKGNYAGYVVSSGGNKLYRRNLLTRTDSLVLPASSFLDFDLTETGKIIYVDNYNIFTKVNGSTAQITNDNPNQKWNVGARADGNYIIYNKRNNISTTPVTNVLYLYDGQNHIQLSDGGTTTFDPDSRYLISGKACVYFKPNLSGQSRLWVRDSAGNEKQIVYISCNLMKLNNKGDVVYRDNDTVYLRLNNGQLLKFNGFTYGYENFGDFYYHDSSWYLTVGRMLYRVKTETGTLELCPSIASTSITSSISGDGYHWQVDTGNAVFTDIVDNINFSGASTATLHLNNIPSSWYGYTFRCMLITGTFSTGVKLKFAEQWIGIANNLWEDTANWSCGTIPDPFTDVVINSGTIVINSNVTIRSLKINPGVSLTVNPGFTLTVLH